jgi:hypothetical protein
MPTAKVTDTEILAQIALGKSDRSIAKNLAVGRGRIRRIKKGLGKPRLNVIKPPAPTETARNEFVDTGNEATAYLTATVPITRKELMATFAINPKKWECVEFRPKVWETARKDRTADLVFDEGKITGTVRDRGTIFKAPMYAVSD